MAIRRTTTSTPSTPSTPMPETTSRASGRLSVVCWARITSRTSSTFHPLITGVTGWNRRHCSPASEGTWPWGGGGGGSSGGGGGDGGCQEPSLTARPAAPRHPWRGAAGRAVSEGSWQPPSPPPPPLLPPPPPPQGDVPSDAGLQWRRFDPVTPVIKGWKVLLVLLVILAQQTTDNLPEARDVVSGIGVLGVLGVLVVVLLI